MHIGFLSLGFRIGEDRRSASRLSDVETSNLREDFEGLKRDFDDATFWRRVDLVRRPDGGIRILYREMVIIAPRRIVVVTSASGVRFARRVF